MAHKMAVGSRHLPCPIRVSTAYHINIAYSVRAEMKDTEYQIGKDPSQGRGHKVEDRSDGAAQLLEGRAGEGTGCALIVVGRGKRRWSREPLSQTLQETQTTHLI